MDGVQGRGKGKAVAQGETGVDETTRPSAAVKAHATGAETAAAAAADATAEKGDKRIATNQQVMTAIGLLNKLPSAIRRQAEQAREKADQLEAWAASHEDEIRERITVSSLAMGLPAAL